MTRQRIYGEDNVWGKWVRGLGQKDGPLPSASETRGTTVNDWDMIVHQYKTPVDRLGTRSIHCMMFIECKTRMADVAQTQTETLWFSHQLLSKKRELLQVGTSGRVAVWHFGVSVLRCDTDDPATATLFTWGRFNKRGHICYQTVSLAVVIDALCFNRDPDTLHRMTFRRHHKTQVITCVETMPLGFDVYTDKVKRP